MKTWIMILKAFGYIWLTLAVIVIFIGYAGVFWKEGFGALTELLSPFNVVGWITVFITLAPGLGALMLSEKLKSKRG
ncbi:MAG: hypothetical protein L6277_10515 [Desulfobacterales bacterium]|nr:hypothetical protein [Pseudomonadota bacterium]MCG2772506.1 hypothetical protein [Desulfobacterales bacterium]